MKMWLFPYEHVMLIDSKGNQRSIGRRVRQCPCCYMTFENNLPWDAKYCPNCGNRNGGLGNDN